jgi:hypothetical protein
MASLKQLIRPFVPVGIIEARQRFDIHENARRARLSGLRANVLPAVEMIRSLRDDQLCDVGFLERELIPALGLNDENLNEQPPELADHQGRGIFIFQYPNQLSQYLVWLAANAKNIRKYVEIGVRWGGTFIFTSEWLRRIGAPLELVAAIDPINPSPLVEEYFKILSDDPLAPNGLYVQEFSTSATAKAFVESERPDMVLIDGDHSFNGALSDHVTVREHASIIVHHDIASDACPDTTNMWRCLQSLEPDFEFATFDAQYPSVNGSFLGIGAMMRKR